MVPVISIFAMSNCTGKILPVRISINSNDIYNVPFNGGIIEETILIYLFLRICIGIIVGAFFINPKKVKNPPEEDDE